jgi:hypothetical protein
MMMAKIMPTLAKLIFQMNLRALIIKKGIFWFYVFPTVYEVKPISRDPGNSREITFKFPSSREIEFHGKWESLVVHW